MTWPSTPADLAREQERLANQPCEPWMPPPGALRIGACAVVFGRAGRDDIGWAAAVVEEAGEIVTTSTQLARIDVPFQAGQLALREAPSSRRSPGASRDGRTSSSSPQPAGIIRVAPGSPCTSGPRWTSRRWA